MWEGSCSTLILLGLGLAILTAPLPLPQCSQLSPTLCCHHPSCWRGCCPGGGCRVGSQVGWLVGSGAAASSQGELVRARTSTARKAGPVGTGTREAGQTMGLGSRAGHPATITQLTCHRAHPRLRTSAAIYHRTLQGRGCLSMGSASRAEAVARSLGSGSSIMVRTERSSEDRPVHRAGPCQG